MFPNPGRVDGVYSMTKPILEAKNCSYRYSDELPWILDHVRPGLTRSPATPQIISVDVESGNKSGKFCPDVGS